MKRVRVLFFLDSLENGGIQAMMKTYFGKINRKKFDVEVLTLETSEESGYFEWLRSSDFKVHVIEGVNLRSVKGQFLYQKKLHSFFKNNEYFDILHMNGSSKNFFVLREAKKSGIKVRIAHSHNTRYQTTSKLQIFLGNILKFPLSHYSNSFFAASNIAGKWLFGETRKTFILPNAINTKKFYFDSSCRKMIRKEMGLENKFVVGNVSRFVYQKNHKKIIDVFNKLLMKNPDAYLVLIGSGELRKATEEYTKELGIRDSVLFVGFRSDIERWLQVMDCYIMPSHYEGLPVVLEEVQATGLPSIVSTAITNEVAVIEHIKFINLSDSDEEWAFEVNRFHNKEIDRKNASEIFKASNFNIDNSIHLLENKYLELVKGSD
ncbi:glycosyltransferase [Enterococcus sp. DIV0756]|uniref:glycosyltransferase n=1 Tax=Enterococcus sp. DIV0756 TaxID=2774636 RepID=UPI003F2545DC